MKNRITGGVKGSFCLLLAVLLSFPVFACQKEKIAYNRTIFALDTVIQITVYEESALSAVEEAFTKIRSYEDIFSRTKETSELYRLNHNGGKPMTVSDDLYTVIEEAYRFAESVKGKYDFTLGGVSDLYHFGTDRAHMPDPEDIQEALRHTGYQKVHLLSDRQIQIEDPELEIDLGSIAKGYIGDRIKEFLLSRRVDSAILNLGGNIALIGEKDENTPFQVGIRSPEKTSSSSLLTVQKEDTSVITSGIYERSFEENGILYHHLLNPETGFPIENEWASVTVITKSGMEGDALSTLLFSLGYEESVSYLSGREDIEVIFIRKDKTIRSIHREE